MNHQKITKGIQLALAATAVYGIGSCIHKIVSYDPEPVRPQMEHLEHVAFLNTANVPNTVGGFGISVDHYLRDVDGNGSIDAITNSFDVLFVVPEMRERVEKAGFYLTEETLPMSPEMVRHATEAHGAMKQVILDAQTSYFEADSTAYVAKHGEKK